MNRTERCFTRHKYEFSVFLDIHKCKDQHDFSFTVFQTSVILSDAEMSVEQELYEEPLSHHHFNENSLNQNP